MKVKTITCHNVYNYGATLQAYALQRYLSELGHDVQIIDYRPVYLRLRYNFWLINENSPYKSICDEYPFLHLMYALLHYRNRFVTGGRKTAFDRFNLEFLKLSSNTYGSYFEICNNLPDADIYIAGSDQIWNSKMPNGKDAAFYLSFVPPGKIRASYAASFGTDSILEENKQFVAKMIKSFDYVSVREKTGLKILESLGITSGVNVVDPVLLLSRNIWESLISRKYNEKYVLVYDFIEDPMIKESALKISKQFGYKIYSINDYTKQSYADKNISNAGPIEFLELIYSAQVIVSNSFHATVFSVIFEKSFYVYDLQKLSNFTRTQDFLSGIGLSEQRINKSDQINLAHVIDYTTVLTSLSKHQKRSVDFLKMILKDDCKTSEHLKLNH